MNRPVNMDTPIRNVAAKGLTPGSFYCVLSVLMHRVLGACSQALSTPPRTLQALSIFRTTVSVGSHTTLGNDLRKRSPRHATSRGYFKGYFSTAARCCRARGKIRWQKRGIFFL